MPLPKWTHITSIGLCLLSLNSGCVPDPTYTGDSSPAPALKYTKRPSICMPKTILPCTEPSEVDHPLDAGDMLDIALNNNPQTQQSWHTARAAAYNIGVAQAALYPTVVGTETIQASTSHGAGSSGVGFTSAGTIVGPSGTGARTGRFGGKTQSLNSDINVSYLLLDYGGRCASIQSARQALLAADWTHNRTLQTVMVTVLTNYYTYIYAAGLVEAKQQDLKDSQTNLEAAIAQFEGGVVTHVDVLQAKANEANAKLQLESAIGQLKIAMGNLATALGWPADTVFDVMPLTDEIPLDAITEDICALVEEAKLARPDLAASYAAYLQAKEAVISATSASLPSVSFYGDAQRTDVFHRPLLSGSSQSAAVSLYVPLFSGFLYENDIANAREAASAAFAAWKNTESNILLQVVIAYTNYTTAVATLKYSVEYLQFAQEAYDEALMNYRMGTGSLLDVLNALTTLSDARTQWLQAKTNIFTSVAQIAYNVGTM